MTDEHDDALPEVNLRRARSGGPILAGGDRVNRVLVIAALTVVVLIVGVLGYAVYATVRPARQPRTAVERQVLVLESELRANPKSTFAWIDYVGALIAAGQNSRAIAAADRGALQVEDKAALLALRAEAEHAIGRDDTALATATEAIKVAYAYRGKMVDQYLQKGVRITPPGSAAIVDAELVRAGIYLERGQTAKAIASYDVALAEDPRMADVLAMRGQVYLKQQNPGKARSDFQQALRYDPKNTDALAGLATTEGELP
jgi:tetratricopeptide (TPR) repeat protein